MTSCLYCHGAGPFNTIEHVVPESLGNEELILKGCVCDACQSYFGREVERYVLEKTPIAVWRALLGIQTKKGRLPTVDVSQPKRTKGKFPDTHSLHDDIVFRSHPDGSTSVDANDNFIVRGLLDGTKQQFNLVLTPKKTSMLGRFLGKIGLGVLAISEPQRAYDKKFDRIRSYARFGNSEEIWPIFHYTKGDIGQWRSTILFGAKGEALLEEVECYSWEIVKVGNAYELFRFSMGMDSWVISLNDPYPTPVIKSAFPDQELNLIWYSHEQWRSNKTMQRSREVAGR